MSVLKKLNCLVVISGFLFSFHLNAQEMSEIPQEVVDNIYAQEFIDAMMYSQLSHETTYKVNGLALNDRCVVFLNKEEILGRLGQFTVATLVNNSVKYDRILSARSMQKHCPNYSNLELEQKAFVWNLILTAMAQFESSCNQQTSAKGPNGTAHGFFQLHLNDEPKYAAKGECKRGASRLDQSAIKCTLGMLDRQMIKQDGELFSNASYWDVLRPKGRSIWKQRAIQKTLKSFSMCSPQMI